MSRSVLLAASRCPRLAFLFRSSICASVLVVAMRTHDADDAEQAERRRADGPVPSRPSSHRPPSARTAAATAANSKPARARRRTPGSSVRRSASASRCSFPALGCAVHAPLAPLVARRERACECIRNLAWRPGRRQIWSLVRSAAARGQRRRCVPERSSCCWRRSSRSTTSVAVGAAGSAALEGGLPGRRGPRGGTTT